MGKKKKKQNGGHSFPGGEEKTGFPDSRADAPEDSRESLAPGERLPGAPGSAMDSGARAAALPVIGKEEAAAARLTLQKYKAGKANLEQKVIDAEQWYKLRNWECMRKALGDGSQVEPVSGWLFNAIANKHAAAMDNFPCPNILPREEGDEGEARMLSAIVPVVLEQNDFEEAYDTEVDDKLKCGTGIFGVFWDSEKLNGLGDISVEPVDVLSLFWEPGVTDIQQSRNLFHVALRDNDLLEEEYPELKGKLGSSSLDLSQYLYDDTVDTTEKSAVIDWYYKKRQNGQTVLHYCKFVNDEVLFATENEPEYRDRGWYDHGLYPYIFDPLFRMKGTPCGFGFVDVAKSAQEYIDRGNQAILQNMLANARPRHFIRNDGSVNEEEYADLSKNFIHVDGNLGQDSVMPIQGKTLSNVYVQVVRDKVDELKETTGNRDISTGGTATGVTAASAIAAMQEAGSKLDRDSSKSSYRAFRKVCLMVIELIRQFYDMPRYFRILGENGGAEYVSYSNQGIQPQAQGTELGVDMGYRLPLFDIEVTAEKQSPYSKMSQNELALQFYSAGFFNPQAADQAMACLDMMDFDRKQFVMRKISQNGEQYQQRMAMQQMMGLTQAVGQLQGGGQPESAPAQPTAQGSARKNAASGESAVTKNARQRVAMAGTP